LEEWKFPDIGSRILAAFKANAPVREPPILDDNRIGAIHALEQACEDVEPCLQRMERKLHPWVSFLILPLFALANAGVVFGTDLFQGLGAPLGLGILLGLVAGKPIGIMLFSVLAIRLGWAGKPSGASYIQMLGVALLGGIGFTMSIFITGLAFEDAGTLAQAKVGILAASLIAGIAGYTLLRAVGKGASREAN
jgi:NhaA family Na+:H+ antiporter